MKKPFKVLVERQLVLKDQDTRSTTPIRLVIGTPRWTKKGVEAVCPVAIEGWWGRLEDIRGIDPMNAMEMAFFFMNSLPKKLPPSKKLLWPNGDLYEGTQVDSSMIVPDKILRRLLKIQRQFIGKQPGTDDG